MKTVKEMSQISGISVRTLHYYDQIGLLTPSFIGENGYRFYDMDAFERLQEILLFRELEFPLKKIKEILSDPSYDKEEALCEQIKWLELKKEHLEKVICHAKSLQENGGNMMTFTAYDKSELEAYQAFEKNPQTDFSVITEEMAAIMRDFAKLKEHSLSDSKVQKQVETLQSYISEHFYPCDMEILSGLGQMYIADNRFTAFIDKAAGQGTASFVSSAIAEYVKNNG
ncbi:MerR family transcriptional regulator [Streptococcus gallolyticus]|uniref:MerR family transcriptional regulator n=1 Tax=Streptococcus gallolyticus TaxID=315405 RepID=UPI0001E09866|nr:MerR family transcriptional regulator [Streptococcus gallolyticus]EFM28644.1 TipAS antibiotic-recognition domain protein [Streptococcus gallolyticus subsp. gallolyticus TX20005]QKI00375.1 MerR family transcriptional regulator [Streptococcus gallolyticus]QWX86444.1 MerR family transcriptional regulator [Streptococcus gallolyticus subsp. gallolyticus TX20005]